MLYPVSVQIYHHSCRSITMQMVSMMSLLCYQFHSLSFCFVLKIYDMFSTGRYESNNHSIHQSLVKDCNAFVRYFQTKLILFMQSIFVVGIKNSYKKIIIKHFSKKINEKTYPIANARQYLWLVLAFFSISVQIWYRENIYCDCMKKIKKDVYYLRICCCCSNVEIWNGWNRPFTH